MPSCWRCSSARGTPPLWKPWCIGTAPTVRGVCRRLLASLHDAEDAFQATFLVLVRRSASVRSGDKVANWLHGVARQTALKARSAAARRLAREKSMADLPEPTAAPEEFWDDLRPVLDQELSRLPAKYRAVFVLCDVEGLTAQGGVQTTRLSRRNGCRPAQPGGEVSGAASTPGRGRVGRRADRGAGGEGCIRRRPGRTHAFHRQGRNQRCGGARRVRCCFSRGGRAPHREF